MQTVQISLLYISIHALRKESDNRTNAIGTDLIYFNPRSP